MMKSVALLSLSLAALVGCGGDDPKKPPVVVVDAPVVTQDDAPPSAACTLAPSVVGPTEAGLQYAADTNGDMMEGTPEGWIMFGALNADALVDLIQLELYEGFTEQEYTAPKTITLAAAEVNYATCGACIRALTDVAADGSAYVDDYFATGGTVNITTLSPTQIAGTISGLQLTHVTINETTFESTPVNDGCDTTVGDFSFTGTVMPAKNGLQGRSFKLQLSK